VDVSDDLLQIFLVIDEESFVMTPKKLSVGTVPLIESLRVHTVKVPHESREIGFRRLSSLSASRASRDIGVWRRLPHPCWELRASNQKRIAGGDPFDRKFGRAPAARAQIIGATGFEPATSCSQGTKTPKGRKDLR